MIRLFFLITLTMSCLLGRAQVLKTTSLNLNATGRIYDVVYIPNVNSYAIVGEFTTVNGFARKNFAFINATSFTVQPSNPITAIDGAIRSIDYKLVGTNNYIVIGGEFNTINGAARESLALLYASGGTAFSGLSVLNWNYFMQGGVGNYDNGIFDLNISGDTLLVAGEFEGINLGSSSPTVCDVTEDNLFALKLTPLTASKFTLINSSPQSFTSFDVGAVSILKASNYYFIGSQNFPINNGGVSSTIQRRNSNLSLNGTFTASVGNRHGFHSLAPLNDTLLLATDGGLNGSASLSSNLIICKLQGNAPTGNSAYAINPLLSLFASNVWGQTGYNGDLFLYKGTTPTIQRHKLNTPLVSNGLDFTQIGSSISVSSAGSHLDTSNNLMRVNNFLFLSEKGMTTVGGSGRTGFAVFCLEPENPTPFINPTLAVCPDETITYQIADVQFETGYKWSYSGTGVEYSINNGAFIPYTVPVMNTTANTSSIKIRFSSASTAGILTVEPYNTCNTTTDYLYAKAQSISITINPLPVITLPFDSLAFTCVIDTMNLVAQSATVGATFQWFYPNILTQVNSNDSLMINGTGVEPSIIYPTGYYYTQVTNPVTGCKNSDSIWVSENTVLPTIEQDSLLISPPEFTCLNTQQVLSASVAGSSIYWTTVTGDTTIQFANPHTIDSINPTEYYAYAVSNTNGCKARQIYTVQANYTTIDGVLSNYSNFPTLVTDTINCMTMALTINCAVDPNDINASNGTAYWLTNNTPVLSLTTADSIGMNVQFHTKTYEFVTENALNGCQFTYNVTVLFDLETPFVAPYTGNHSINCSVDTLTMVHLETGGYVTGSWLDGGGNSTGSSTVFVNGTGTFIYEVTDTINGCVNTDTVQVIQTPELFLAETSDTVVCSGDLFLLNVSAINVSETVSYNWSNGTSGSSTTAIGGIDSVLTVIATTPSGCIGYDTIQVSITAPIQASFTGFMGCGASNGSIQVTNVTGGAGTYTYSIDGGAFSNNLLFDSLTVGEHAILIQDALGCVYSFSDTLDASAGSPEMSFLITTYSQTGDTLAVVNNTLYQGFDSTAWVFPVGTLVIFTSDSLALIQLPDTNIALITLVGYQDTCSYSFSKTIYIDSIMPEYPTTYSALKIQSITVYPNPTTGSFTLDLVFGIAQNYGVFITTDLGQPVVGMNQSGYGTAVSLPFSFPNGTPPATYHVHLVSDFDARQLTLILN